MVKSIFVNGTFDVLHPGHLRLLSYAKNLGDRLFVAIDSDRRVSELKGSGRPINPANERREMLLALKAVDEVEIFDSAEELALMVKQIRPYAMVLGSDYKDKTVIGREYTRYLFFYERIEQYSSTGKIQDITNRGLVHR